MSRSRLLILALVLTGTVILPPRRRRVRPPRCACRGASSGPTCRARSTPRSRPGSQLDQQLALMAASGVENIRVTIDWSTAQPYQSWSQVPQDRPDRVHQRRRRADAVGADRPARGAGRLPRAHRAADGRRRAAVGRLAQPRHRAPDPAHARAVRGVHEGARPALRAARLVLGQPAPGRAHPPVADLERAEPAVVLADEVLPGPLRHPAQGRARRDQERRSARPGGPGRPAQLLLGRPHADLQGQGRAQRVRRDSGAPVHQEARRA